MGYSDIVCWKVDFLLLGTWDAQPEGFLRQMSSMNRGGKFGPTVCKASLVNDFYKSSAVYRGHIPYPPGTKGGYKKLMPGYIHSSPLIQEILADLKSSCCPVMDSGRVYSRS